MPKRGKMGHFDTNKKKPRRTAVLLNFVELAGQPGEVTVTVLTW